MNTSPLFTVGLDLQCSAVARKTRPIVVMTGDCVQIGCCNCNVVQNAVSWTVYPYFSLCQGGRQKDPSRRSTPVPRKVRTVHRHLLPFVSLRNANPNPQRLCAAVFSRSSLLWSWIKTMRGKRLRSRGLSNGRGNIMLAWPVALLGRPIMWDTSLMRLNYSLESMGKPHW